MELHLSNNKKVTLIALVVIALVSVFFLSKLFSSVSFHQASIAFLDKKKLTVAGLTISVSTASTLLAAVPGDATTPVANQLASASSWLLMITCVIVMEKYLLTLIGFLSFTYIIPAACILYAIFLFTNKQFLRELGIKLGLFGIAIFLIIPTSVQITRVLETTHSDIAALTTNVEQIDEDIQNDVEQADENQNLFEQAADFFSGIGEEVLETIKTEVSKFMDAIAILFVTTCAIPILVLFAFTWLLKLIFNLDIPLPRKLAHPFEKKEGLQKAEVSNQKPQV